MSEHRADNRRMKTVLSLRSPVTSHDDTASSCSSASRVISGAVGSSLRLQAWLLKLARFDENLSEMCVLLGPETERRGRERDRESGREGERDCDGERGVGSQKRWGGGGEAVVISVKN